jgi:hypothetical protein
LRAKKPFIGWMFIFSICLGLVTLAVLLTNPNPVGASVPTPLPKPPGPDRFTTMTVDTTMYEWWLAAWHDNKVLCSFYVDHAGLPVDADIYSACDNNIYTGWKENSQPCLEKEPAACPGYYFIQVSTKPGKRDVTIKLPPPDVRVSLDGCQPDNSGWCTQQPSLVLTAEEPLPNDSITAINGFAGTDPFICKGKTCIFKLSPTTPNGIRLTFWALSTHGDSSEVFNALLRVTSDGDTNRLTPRWSVDVISSQWNGAPLASCAITWESFPPSDGLPQWLTTPASSQDLKSNIPYNYLAANLISQGITDASSCPGRGLLPDGSVNACGLKAAAPAVEEWQNRFDKLIFKVAQDTEVPAQLLKNIFSRESQFWPGVFRNSKDVGLGQMTVGGADTTLLWNPSFYAQFCPLVLDGKLCKSRGFAKLKPAQQSLLRGALIGSVDASCDNCPLGLDLSRADFSVSIFAHTLLANCEQAGKIVQNVTYRMPGQTLDYATLWRLTLVNYNAGSGCLAEAITQAYNPSIKDPLSWDRVAPALESACPGSTTYVQDIISDTGPTPTPGPTPDNNSPG